MSKWLRNYKLTYKKKDQDEITVSYPLTIEFNVARSDLSQCGEAMFRIFNVNPAHRWGMYANYTDLSMLTTSIKFDAGYGDNLSTVFNGCLQWANSFRASGSVDVVTQLRAFDYGIIVKNSPVSFSVEGKAASQKAVITSLCHSLEYVDENGTTRKLPVGAIGEFDETEKTKRTVCGASAWELLKTESGRKCFIDNGKVYVLNENEVIDDEVVLINDKTGLIGTPRVDQTQLIIETIFTPSLRVGQRINLVSSYLPKDQNGIYKVIGLSHSGTISGAMGGQCMTRAKLFVGSAGKNDPFSIVSEN